MWDRIKSNFRLSIYLLGVVWANIFIVRFTFRVFEPTSLHERIENLLIIVASVVISLIGTDGIFNIKVQDRKYEKEQLSGTKEVVEQPQDSSDR